MTCVLIVENDPMVAEIQRHNLQRDARVDVVAICPDPHSAWDYLQTHSVDLILMEVSMDGFGLFQKVRRKKLPVELAAITAANDLASLEQALQLGVLDYIIKPFDWDRFKLAVDRYFLKSDALHHGETRVSQQEADRLFSFCTTELTRRPAEKGIYPRTLEHIRTFFRTHIGQSWSCGQVAEEVGLSRVTVHKYLHYMEQNRQLISCIDYKTEGRPRLSYMMEQ